MKDDNKAPHPFAGTVTLGGIIATSGEWLGVDVKVEQWEASPLGVGMACAALMNTFLGGVPEPLRPFATIAIFESLKAGLKLDMVDTERGH